MSTLRTNEIKMLDDRGAGSFTFDSVADLKDASQISVGQKVRTLGYYAPGDGGGNDYEIVAAGTGSNYGFLFEQLSGSGLEAKLLGGGIIEDKTAYIPTDYATLQEAIDDLSKVRVTQGVTIDLMIEAGHSPESGIFVSNGSYSHFSVSSEDTTLTLGTGFSGRFIQARFASAPTLNAYVDGNGVADRIYSLEGSCTGKVENGKGGANTTGRIFYIQSSFLQAPQTQWRNGGESAYSTSGSGLQLGGVIFEDFTSSLATLQISRGSSAEAAGMTMRNCKNGLHAKRAGSSINAHNSTFTGVERVFLAERGAAISALDANCTEVGGLCANVRDGYLELTGSTLIGSDGNSNSCIESRFGRVSMGHSNISGFGNNGIRAQYASSIKADNCVIEGSGNNGILAKSGSCVEISDGSITGSGFQDLRIANGSQIVASGTSTTNGTGSPSLSDTNLNGGFNIDASNGNRGFIWV